MKRKRGFVVGCLFILIFVIGVVLSGGVGSALNCDNQPKQLILRLSAETNAHGERATVSPANYQIEICYNTIFGSLNPSSNAPDLRTNCDGGAKVLGLYGDTNAHAEIPTRTTNGYSDVCYKGLICRAVASSVEPSASCNSAQNEKPVVRLSAETNAQLEKGGYTSNVPGYSPYSKTICCKPATVAPPPPPPSAQRAYWADSNDFEYTESTGVATNVQVKLFATGVPTGAENQITFIVYDSDCSPLTNKDPTCSDKITSSALSGTKYSNGVSVASWTTTDSGNDETDENPLQLYFIATYNALPAVYSRKSGFINLNRPSVTLGCAFYQLEPPCNYDSELNLNSDKRYLVDAATAGVDCTKADTICYCNWINNDHCEFGSRTEISTPTGCSYGCKGSYSYGLCLNNKQDLTVTRTIENSNGCQQAELDDAQKPGGRCPASDTIQNVPCGQLIGVLPFFGEWQFMISILGIVGIYFFVVRRERRLKGNVVKNKPGNFKSLLL